MRLSFACLFFGFSSVMFTFADYIVQFTDPVRKILEVAKDKEVVKEFSVDTFNIHEIKCRKFVRGLFKKDCFENAPIYAKILLKSENEVLDDTREKLIIMELLHRINVIFLLSKENFGMTYEQARNLERSFRDTMKLIDPLYH